MTCRMMCHWDSNRSASDIVVTDGRGVFTTFDADGSYDIIEGMDIEGIEGRIKEYHNAKLESGSSIEISSTLKVKLVPKD